MKVAISSTWSGVFTAVSCRVHRDNCHEYDHDSATMRDFRLSWDVVVGSLWCWWCLVCELPTASLADQARVCCGC